MKTYLITGCAGFIGSNFVYYMLKKHDDILLVNLDKLTYAGNLENLKGVEGDKRHIFVQGDICDKELVTALFELAHQRGVHTVLDTAGQPYRADAADQRAFERLMDVTDLVMLDLKAMDEKLHRRVTGTGNVNILAMARKLSDMGKPMWIRHVLVPGLTDSEDDLRQMAAFIGTLKTVERVEILPYHTLGLSKWKKLGIAYPLDGVPAPTADEVTRAERILGIC